MGFGGSKTVKVQQPKYDKFEDTPWITQGRQIADIGGQGVLDNYNKVNVFDDNTRRSIEARNNEVYNRAFGDMERNYMNTMNKYNAANYNRFGTLNATAPYYITDQYQRDFQRQMDDLAYNKAVNYENLVNNELQRRYNTLDMFGNMYGYGTTPHSVDIANWNTSNTNKDLAMNAALQSNTNNSGFSNMFNALGVGTAGSQLGQIGGVGNMMPTGLFGGTGGGYVY